MPDTESTSFLKSIARYFMDFLETDFHRRRVPRRSIKLKNDTGQLLGVSIDKYPTFDKEIWGVLNRKFDNDGIINLQRGRYKANIPDNLLALIKRQIESLDSESIDSIRAELVSSITNYGATLKDEFTKARELVEKGVTKAIDKNLTEPLVSSIEKSLALLEAADENTAYQIKTELTELFVANIMPVAETILQSVILEEEVDVTKKVKTSLTLKTAKSTLSDYFDDLATNDLYQELAEIDSNRLILDKQELYLYFFDVTFQKTKYPLFYIPAQVNKADGSLQLQFDSKVYVNKKAVEYIAQEMNAEDKSISGNPMDFDRIMYLSTFETANTFVERLQDIVSHLVTYFDLKGELALTAERTMSRNASLKITNAAHFVLFDKADEALINDYEQILDLDANSELFTEFEAIVNGFIADEPKDVAREVESEWDNRDSTEKLSFESPVPLNEEQLQILQALDKDECRFVSVQGPPGTGKSHTITAIVFNAIMQNKSVLVLSDKKEALDVVEDKIADTLNNVRFGTDFQNPILRLGSVNNFRKILSAQAIDNIKLSHKLTGKKLDQLEQSINANLTVTKDQIHSEIEAYGKVNKNDIMELERLEDALQSTLKKIDSAELLTEQDSEVRLHEIRQSYNKLLIALSPENQPLVAIAELKLIPTSKLHDTRLDALSNYMQIIGRLAEHTQSVTKELNERGWQAVFNDFPSITDDDIQELGQYILRFESLKKPVVGFAFNKTKLNDLTGEFNQRFGTNFVSPTSDLTRIRRAHEAFSQLLTLKQHLPFPDNVKTRIDYLSFLTKLLNEDMQTAAQTFASWHDELQYLIQTTESLPKNFGTVSSGSLNDLGKKSLVTLEDIEAERLMRWVHLMNAINGLMGAAPFYSYRQCMETIQKQVALRMAQILDGRVIDFYTDSRATATVIKDVIKAKQKFPRETFSKLKEAFPCILASIREYADYIPLEVGIFDLVIIDEASQVSVAQAFPALIRGKKVIVMGDKLQFGNVKSYQARSEINTEYRNRLKETFTKGVTSEMSALKRIERLDVKKSILDFSEFVSNYQIMLKKHFRSYPENISFSNKYFYENALQVMKIRGKKIDDVLKFTIIDHDGKVETRPNTNHPEAEFILGELRKLAETKDTRNSIGIITPHTNQQRYIFELLRDDPNFDFYITKLKLKVMTFDTCQGEERDTIYYSMVATENDDKLVYIFPRDVMQTSYDDDSNSEIRRQRLNVGLSRSKETMHFVLSKPIESFSGSAAVALNHYANLKEEVSKRLTSDAVDQKSPMEKKVLGWIYETPFWKKNAEAKRCELHAQFELGTYLKALDQTYNHPEYVVDFMLFYQDEGGRQFKVIFEYDGFEEHFENRNMVDQYNYDSYLKEDDIYRQKVLESYGYEFIRLNKFNIGTNPIEYINSRIEKLIDGSLATNSIGHDIDAVIRGQAQGLSMGELKECKNCGRIIPLEEFKDSSLTSGMGRICKDCKASKPKSEPPQATDQVCPRCGRPLLKRKGRYGQFYGCTGFPYCKYTRNTT
jgi:superfamily I DNA and/or RNA helicase/very-short-patch-repair endonuclease